MARSMKDIEIELDNDSGSLARMGHALGRAGLSVEGGGAWVVDGRAVAHFLFKDGEAAKTALEEAGMRVTAMRDVVVQPLDQDDPAQLGELSAAMAEAGVKIEVLYNDHDNQLVLVVDDVEKGRSVADTWVRGRGP
jgi:hypothetical protein